jgi:hypothetical protein
MLIEMSGQPDNLPWSEAELEAKYHDINGVHTSGSIEVDPGMDIVRLEGQAWSQDIIDADARRPGLGSWKFCVDYLSVYVLASSHPSQACASTRQRNRSNPARPYMSRLMTLSRLT